MASCGGEKNQQKVETEAPKTEVALEPQIIDLGDRKLEFTSNLSFIKDEKKSDDLKLMSDQIVTAGFYNLKKIPHAIGNLFYYKLNTPVPSMEGAPEDLISRFNLIEGITTSDEKIEDVSDQYGFEAIIGTGKMVTQKEDNSFQNGEFVFLILDTDTERFLFQVSFTVQDSHNKDEFMRLLESIKLK